MILVSCGSNDKKKKDFNIIVLKVKLKNDPSETNKVPIDLNNKGIGPIKELVFDDAINKTMADEGKKLLLLNAQLVTWLREN